MQRQALFDMTSVCYVGLSEAQGSLAAGLFLQGEQPLLFPALLVLLAPHLSSGGSLVPSIANGSSQMQDLK